MAYGDYSVVPNYSAHGAEGLEVSREGQPLGGSVGPSFGLVDLSRPVHPGMPVFPEDPEVEFVPAPAMPPWRVTALRLGTHSGTHIDAAAHYVPGGATIDEYPLERFVLPAYVVPLDSRPGEAVAWPALAAALPGDIGDDAVLLHTGWDRHWGDALALEHPYLSEDTARGLVARGAGLVGTDALNVDGTAAGTTYAHEILLGAGVLIVENLTRLDVLEPGRSYTCAFVPLRLEGADGMTHPCLRLHRVGFRSHHHPREAPLHMIRTGKDCRETITTGSRETRPAAVRAAVRIRG